MQWMPIVYWNVQTTAGSVFPRVKCIHSFDDVVVFCYVVVSDDKFTHRRSFIVAPNPFTHPVALHKKSFVCQQYQEVNIEDRL